MAVKKYRQSGCAANSEKSRNTIAGNRGNEGIQQIDKKRNKSIYKIQKEI